MLAGEHASCQPQRQFEGPEVNMSKSQSVRGWIEHRLSVAAQDIFILFERMTSEHEEQLSRSREESARHRKLLDAVLSPEVLLHRADAEVSPVEQQEGSSSLDQEDSETVHIKEEQEELWSSQEGLDEADIKFPFTPVSVKSEDDEEKPQSSQLHHRHTEEMETGADGEDCGGAEPERDSDPERPLQEAGVRTEDSSEPETEDTLWKESREHQPGFNLKKINEVTVSRRTGEKPFICSVCGKRLGYSGHLKTHMRTHTGEKPFSCSVCGKRFTQKCSLTQHMVLHTGEKPFSCSVCDQRFSWRSQIRRHECVGRQASELQPIQTEEKREDCGRPEPAWTSDPERHLQPEIEVKIEDFSEPEAADRVEDWMESRGHESGLNSLINHDVSVSYRAHDDTKPFSCSQCEKSFTRQRNLMKHMRSHTGEKPFHCSVCSKRFSHKETLVRHKKFHSGEKPFSCSVCSKDFSRKENFARHMRFHSGEKPFSCSFCSKLFTRRDHAMTHMRTHTGEKPFSCSECGKRMGCRTSLRVHMRTHTGERPFSCSCCGKRFTQRSSLREHMALHTGTRSFHCSECGKTVGCKSSLKVHMRTHAGEKPFNCSVCGKGFIQKANLTEHMASHNEVKPFSYTWPSETRGHRCVSDASGSSSGETFSVDLTQEQPGVEMNLFETETCQNVSTTIN
ncbi:zinc finger protein ZFP2-like [Labrus mixtus]|uniref:zinc finger protein ZFP2-like n=1 Tax=Labrus mixtus TaxID=508554 RepID=UPI0029C054C3|nr:zinc finger protein ZFP2-like [Labrus mixtus]